MEPTRAQRLAGRKLWRPKNPEVAAQCASCPFRVGNDAEWRAVVERLRAKLGLTGLVTRSLLAHGRIVARMDVENQGDFSCHGTAYDEDMNPRPRSEHRQCKGASDYFREGS